MQHMTNPDTRIRYNTLRRMPHIKASTLVCWGTDDQTNAFEMGEQTAATIPGARLVPFEGVGHMLPQQAADGFNEVVLEFLTSVGRREGPRGADRGTPSPCRELKTKPSSPASKDSEDILAAREAGDRGSIPHAVAVASIRGEQPFD